MSTLTSKESPGRICRECKQTYHRQRDWPRMEHQVGRSPFCNRCCMKSQAAANFTFSAKAVADRKLREALK